MTNLPPPTPFDYTTRDYASLRDTLIRQMKARIPGWTGDTDPNDFVHILLECVAYTADSMHYYLDRIANEAYITSAVRPESIMSMARLVGYRPARGTSATVELAFTNENMDTVAVSPGTRVQTSLTSEWDTQSTDPLPVIFETVDHVVLAPGETDYVTAREGVTFRGSDGTGEVLAVSNGYAWQSHTIPHAPVATDSISVSMGYTEGWSTDWGKVEDIRSAAASAPVFQVDSPPNGPVRIRFGNGQSGAIPPNGAVIKATYRVGGGSRGNVGAGTLVVVSDDLALAGVSVTNPNPAFGGTDDESLESIRTKIIWRGVSTPDKATSLVDYERIALAAQGVGKARAQAPDPADIRVAVGPRDDGTEKPGMYRQVRTVYEAGPGNYFLLDMFPRFVQHHTGTYETQDNAETLNQDDPSQPVLVPGKTAAWEADEAISISGSGFYWDGSKWESGMPQGTSRDLSDVAPEWTLHEDFQVGVRSRVESVLRDATFAGSQVAVVLPRYRPVWVRMRVHMANESSQRLEQHFISRMRSLFHYENVSFEQRISVYDLLRMFVTSEVLSTDVLWLSHELWTTLPDVPLGNEDGLLLNYRELPYLPAELRDDQMFQFVYPSNESGPSALSGQNPDSFLLKSQGVPLGTVTHTTRTIT